MLAYEGMMSLLSFGFLTGQVLSVGHSKAYSICYKDSLIFNESYLEYEIGGDFLNSLIKHHFNLEENNAHIFKQNSLRFSWSLE